MKNLLMHNYFFVDFFPGFGFYVDKVYPVCWIFYFIMVFSNRADIGFSS